MFNNSNNLGLMDLIICSHCNGQRASGWPCRRNHGQGKQISQNYEILDMNLTCYMALFNSGAHLQNATVQPHFTRSSFFSPLMSHFLAMAHHHAINDTLSSLMDIICLKNQPIF